MTDVHDLVKRVEDSPEFKAFRKENPTRYLVHVFVAKTGNELGYYDAKDDTIVVFQADPIVMRPPEGVFKEKGTLEKLNLDNVTLDIAGIRAFAKQHMEETYANHPLQQEILVLQQKDTPAWNCTFVTKTLNMIILKVDASTGSILHEELRNILDLRQ